MKKNDFFALPKTPFAVNQETALVLKKIKSILVALFKRRCILHRNSGIFNNADVFIKSPQSFPKIKKKVCMKKRFFIPGTFFIIILVLFAAGCRSVPSQKSQGRPLSRQLLGKGIMSAKQLASFFIQNNPDADYAHILNFARIYIDEANAEGINSDVAFAQMCLETGYLRFGGLVQPEWHNYCGLGAMDAAHPGEIFETERLGVRAHIQHLQAYATTEDVPLKKELIDPRYSWVHKTKLAVTVDDLAGTWATDPAYGAKLDDILERMAVNRAKK